MFCCLGLFAGFAAGSLLGGGPWGLVAPAMGFGLGLIADILMMKHGLHGVHKHDEKPAPEKEKELLREPSTDKR